MAAVIWYDNNENGFVPHRCPIVFMSEEMLFRHKRDFEQTLEKIVKTRPQYENGDYPAINICVDGQDYELQPLKYKDEEEK